MLLRQSRPTPAATPARASHRDAHAAKKRFGGTRPSEHGVWFAFRVAGLMSEFRGAGFSYGQKSHHFLCSVLTGLRHSGARDNGLDRSFQTATTAPGRQSFARISFGRSIHPDKQSRAAKGIGERASGRGYRRNRFRGAGEYNRAARASRAFPPPGNSARVSTGRPPKSSPAVRRQDHSPRRRGRKNRNARGSSRTTCLRGVSPALRAE